MASNFIAAARNAVTFEISRIVRLISSTRASVAALAAMLCVDLAFIIYSGLQSFRWLPKDRWHIALDGGIPEKWQYVKWGILIVLLLAMFRHRRAPIYLAWATLFTYFLLDDSLTLHETFGLKIGTYLGFKPALGLGPQHFGELVVTALASIPLFGFLAICYVKETSHADKEFSRGMLLLVLALAFCGVIVDELDLMMPSFKVRTFLELVEDGGEMAVASIMVCYVNAQVRWQRRHASAMPELPSAGS